MKKKLLALLLCVIMLLSCTMASCGGTDQEDPEETKTSTARSAMTLVWALVCDEIPSEKTQTSIETAVNKITESRYTTHIDLQFYLTDEYQEVIEAKLVANQEEVKIAEDVKKLWKRFVKANKTAKDDAGVTYKVESEKLYEMFWDSYPEYEKYVQPEVTTGEDETETEAETVLNEYNIGVLAYPAAGENQIDILYISGYQNYVNYINNEWLAQIDEEIAQDSKVLKDYIFPAFITAAKTEMGTYAVPNNTTIGDYTYLLLHKDLIKNYYYVVENIDGLTSSLCQNFLEDVARYESDEFVPLLYNEETRTPQNIKYWNLEYTADENGTVLSQKYSDKFSILGSTYQKTITQEKNGASVYQCMSILSDSKYTEQLKTLKGYEANGYYGEGSAETRTFAAGIVTGDAYDLVPMYSDDYHMVVIDYPRGTEEDLFQHMWAVSAYCADVGRAMEIITYLNTNVDFRNLIQYGELGVNYMMNETTGALERLNKDYMMDINKTGNVFIAYPEEGMDPKAWDYGKLQNQDALVDLVIGFSISDVTDDDYVLNTKGMDAVISWTEKVQKDIAACKSAEDVEIYLNGFKLAANADISSLSEIQKSLLAYNEITASTAAEQDVKGVLNFIGKDEYISMMTNVSYAPSDPFEVDKSGKTISKNVDHYGEGESLHAVYRAWAIAMGFFKEEKG